MTIALKPVSEWVYALFRVHVYESQGGKLISTLYYVATRGDQVLNEDDYLPRRECWIEWEVVEDKVPAPRNVGTYYGMPISESGFAAGQRMAEARKLAA